MNRPTSCEQLEFDLAELVDGRLTPEREALARAHLATCARCRQFLLELQNVDATLVRALPQVPLTEDFDARLSARIADLKRAPPRDTARDVAELEYRGTLDMLKRGLRLQTALDALAAASVAGGVVMGLVATGPGLLDSIGFAGQVGGEVVASVVSTAAIAIGLVSARRIAGGPFIG